jgi:hypothetical protein
MMDIKKVEVINKLYNTKPTLPIHWDVVKYKHRNPKLLPIINLTIENTDCNITCDDFTYYSFRDVEEQKLSIILFINDDKIKYLAAKESCIIKKKKHVVWMPINHGIYSILEAAVGEYHLMNTLNNMEINPDIEINNLSNEIDIDNIRPLHDLYSDIQVVVDNPLSKINKCIRCKYNNNRHKLTKCICGNVYYCDDICKNAHYYLHKYICK